MSREPDTFTVTVTGSTKQVARREWIVNVIEPAVDDQGYRIVDAETNTPAWVRNPDFEAELHAILVELGVILRRIGGTVAIGAQRAQIDDELYENYRVLIRWEAFAPTVDLRPPEADASGEPEAEQPAEPEPAPAPA